MADLINYSVTKQGNAWLIQGDIVDSSDHTKVLQHIGGAQGINFINAINALPDDAMQQFVENNALWLLQNLYPDAWAGTAAKPQQA